MAVMTEECGLNWEKFKKMLDNCMDDNKTILKMLPVCSCGYVFRKGVMIYENINETHGWKYATYSIQPSQCPSCHKTIEGIESENYRFKHNE